MSTPTRRPFSSTSAISGALAFGLLFAQAAVARQVVPHLIDLLKSAPRLAFSGFLGLILFPGIVAMVVHHVGSQMLDQYDSEAPRRVLPRTESWWTGAFTFMVVYGVTILTRITYLIVNPPPPRDDAFSMVAVSIAETIEIHANIGTAITIYAALWIATATGFFELERRTRKS